MPSLLPHPPHPAFTVISGHLREAALALFADYEIPVRARAVPRAMPARGLVAPGSIAAIGFAGRGIRGSVVMVALDTAVEAWLAALEEPPIDLADVLGEFSNMLLGRLKTRLLAEGIALSVSTPTTTSGSGMRVSMPPGASTWVSLDGDGWELDVRIDAYFDATFALEHSTRSYAPAEAGAVILF